MTMKSISTPAVFILTLMLPTAYGLSADGIGDPIQPEAVERIWNDVVRSYQDPFVKSRSFIIPETYLIQDGRPGSCSLAFANVIFNCDKNGYLSGLDPKLFEAVLSKTGDKGTVLKKVMDRLILEYQSDMRGKNEKAKVRSLDMRPPAVAYASIVADGSEEEVLQSVTRFFHNRDATCKFMKTSISWNRFTELMDRRCLVIVSANDSKYFCFGYIENNDQKIIVTAGITERGQGNDFGFNILRINESRPREMELRPFSGETLNCIVLEGWTRDDSRLTQRIGDIVKSIGQR